MGLREYVIRRSIYTLILLFFVLTLNFVIFELMPGDPVSILAGSMRLRPEQVEILKHLFGLDRPLHERYLIYIKNMLLWRFGISFHYLRPVADLIKERLPNTLVLMGISTILAIIVGTIIGIYAAHRHGTMFDVVVVTTSLVTYSLPTFWMGLVFLLIFGYKLRWFPLGGTIPREWAIHPPTSIVEIIIGRLRHLFLPCLTLFLFSYGTYVLLMRSVLLEVLSEDYITTARAKGLDERVVLFKHALRNAMLPLITQAALALASIISGAIITETVFSWEGMGMLIWDAIMWQDYPVLQATFYIIALVTILANFAADLLYGLVDPRIKYE